MKAKNKKQSVLNAFFYRFVTFLLLIVLIGSSNLSLVNAQDEPTDTPETSQNEEIRDTPEPTIEATEEPQSTPTLENFPTEETLLLEEAPTVEYTLEPTLEENSNVAPWIEIIEPSEDVTLQQGDILTIRWEDEDPDDNALISLIFDTDNQPDNDEGETLIVQGLVEDPDGDSDYYTFSTEGYSVGDYYIFAEIRDTSSQEFTSESSIKIRIEPTSEILSSQSEVNAQTTHSYGEVLVYGSTWSGVNVYSNGSDSSGTYQCVELVKRFLSRKYGMPYISVGNATNMWVSNSSLYNLKKFENGGTELPKWGDILVSAFLNSSKDPLEDGHVAIVTGTDKNHVYIVEQNWGGASGSGKATLSMTTDGGKYNVADRSNGQVVLGWMRVQPILSSPANGTYYQYLPKPTFKWASMKGASSYTLQVSTSSGFSSTLINKTGITTNSFTSSSYLPRNKKVYWRVKANNSKNWSEVYYMTMPNPPTIPVLSSPASNALVTDYTPVLKWSVSKPATGTTFDHYQLQISTSSSFSSLAFENDDLNPIPISGYVSYEVSSTLASNTKYYWRVRGYNTNNEYSAWSSVWYFRSAMTKPVLSDLASGASPLTLRPSFNWGSVTGASNYTIQFSKSSSMSSPFKSVTTTSSGYTATSDMPKNIKIYWRVRANGTNGPSEWSSVRYFYSPNPPSVPSLVSPVKGASTTDLTPKLDWSTVSVPSGTTFDHYKVQVSTDTSFSDSGMVINKNITGVSNSYYTVPTNLIKGKKYYWHVRAYNSDGEYSNFSSLYYFTTK